MGSIRGGLVFCAAFASAAFLGPAFSGNRATADDASRPNILFIFSDDHAWQAVSAYNEPRKLLATPHLDRIAREGMRFNRCIVPNSICGPSRATILTGKYSHLNGFYNNSNSYFDGSQTTFPKLLRGAGYQTAISKANFQASAFKRAPEPNQADSRRLLARSSGEEPREDRRWSTNSVTALKAAQVECRISGISCPTPFSNSLNNSPRMFFARPLLWFSRSGYRDSK